MNVASRCNAGWLLLGALFVVACGRSHSGEGTKPDGELELDAGPSHDAGETVNTEVTAPAPEIWPPKV